MTHMYFSARAEGRISYGHLGRTNSCYYCHHHHTAALCIAGCWCWTVDKCESLTVQQLFSTTETHIFICSQRMQDSCREILHSRIVHKHDVQYNTEIYLCLSWNIHIRALVNDTTSISKGAGPSPLPNGSSTTYACTVWRIAAKIVMAIKLDERNIFSVDHAPYPGQIFLWHEGWRVVCGS